MSEETSFWAISIGGFAMVVATVCWNIGNNVNSLVNCRSACGATGMASYTEREAAPPADVRLVPVCTCNPPREGSR